MTRAGKATQEQRMTTDIGEDLANVWILFLNEDYEIGFTVD